MVEKNIISSETLILKNAAQVVTLADLKRDQTGVLDIGILENCTLVVEKGLISWIGLWGKIDPQIQQKAQILDVSGKTVIPGIVECHTHTVFAGNRAKEFAMRSEGATYEEIAAAGGGIWNTVQKTREASEEVLINLALKRLDRFLEFGITTLEIKSGYGLSLEQELKMLKVINKLNQIHSITVIPTFLGAHTFPRDRNRSDYLKEIISEMIPQAAEQNLAKFCDVFCERGAFSVEESKAILKAGQKHGLLAKIHADQLSNSGASALAAQIGAISADHLDYTDEDSIKALSKAGVTPVLLPGATFFLGHKNYPSARAMLQAGLPVALSTDYNPGSSPTQSPYEIMTIACTQLQMTPAEALAGFTINAAYALNQQDQIGSIEVGKKADLVILDTNSYLDLAYCWGENLVSTVIKNGQICYKK